MNVGLLVVISRVSPSSIGLQDVSGSGIHLLNLNIPLTPPGSVLDPPDQLPTGGVNVIAPRGSDGSDVASLVKNVLEPPRGIHTRSPEIALRKRIEGNQVDLARKIPQQHRQFPGVLGLIVHPLDNGVLDCS